MKRVNTFLAVSLLLLAGVFGQPEAGGKPTAEQSIAAMGCLAGNWSGPAWGGEFRAYYTTSEGGKVLSYSELVREGVVAYHEFERFEALDGGVVFTPFPRGKPATSLRLVDIDVAAHRFVFENPNKDYPTRIVYHRVSQDNLVITLSDPHGGSDKVERFDLRR